MKAALIPPKGYYNSTAQSDYHLMLAQNTDPEYIGMYSSLPPDNYIIMDNGAAEGATVRDNILLHRATAMGVDEVVVPDEIGDSEGTIARAHRFFGAAQKDAHWQKYKYMGVVQSQGDHGGIMECIHSFAEMPINVLGVPRHLVTNDKYARFNILSMIKGYGFHKRFEVHLLGTNPKWSAEISVIQEVHPWVRGVDSSLPYNYSIVGERLTAKFRDNNPIARPEGYFDTIRKIDPDLLQDNIDTFMRWARGTEGTAS
jgi:hypothetical protein